MTYFAHFTGAARACWMWMWNGPRCLMYCYEKNDAVTEP
jgi:hypothetical protein